MTSQRLLPRLTLALGLYAIMVGALAFAGWLLHIPQLTDWTGSGITQKTNNAIASVIAGIAIVTLTIQPRASVLPRLLAAVLMVLGGLTLFQHITDVDLHIDTFLFSEPAGELGTASPNRMGPLACIIFLLFGIGIFLGTGSKFTRKVAFALGAIILALSAIPFIGYMYGASILYTIPRLTAIAFQTTTIFIALALSLMTLLPEAGLIMELVRKDAGGKVLRWLLISIVILPLAFGWLTLKGELVGLYDTRFGTATLVFLLIVCLAMLVLYAAMRVGRITLALHAANAQLESSRAELISLNQKKDEFQAMLAHELRNPVAAIYNAAHLMKNYISEPSGTEIIEIQIDQVKQLIHLVDDLLDVTRIAQGKISISRKPLDLRNVVQHAVGTLRHHIEARSQTLQVSLPDVPVIVDGDRLRLVQVLSNLLDNACKFSNNDGNIELRLETIRTNGRASALIIVIDDGRGIDDNALQHIFDLFYQEESSRAGSAGGVGIGLSLAKKLVELHDGSIRAESEGPGLGTKFTITLPCVDAGSIHLITNI